MSRSPRGPQALAAALLSGALVIGSAGIAHADPQAPVENLIAPVEDIVPEVESMDGSQSESTEGKTVTVGVKSDVLFKVDKADLTNAATARLKQIAAKIKSESAGGAVQVEGHTDDQGSDAYNQKLSNRRAQSVQKALQQLLGGQAVQAKGFGESKPKVPNMVDGQPSKKNRAKNRRVEIIYQIKE